MKFESIVVGLDFSDAAVDAAAWIAAHVAPRALLTLVHVIDPPDRPAYAEFMLPPSDEVERLAREAADASFRRIEPRLPRPVQFDVRVGKPHEGIIACARERSADLIALGPHGATPNHLPFLGTTADRVVRSSPIPVLVAIAPRARPPRHLLAPVDDSAVTATQLACVRDVALAFDARVTLLHVWSNALYSHVASMSYAGQWTEEAARADLDAEVRRAGQDWLDALAATGLGSERAEAVVMSGNAGATTLAVAAERDVDLIIVGRRAANPLVPALLGSTIGTVLHGARCPVLVVPPAAKAANGG